MDPRSTNRDISVQQEYIIQGWRPSNRMLSLLLTSFTTQAGCSAVQRRGGPYRSSVIDSISEEESSDQKDEHEGGISQLSAMCRQPGMTAQWWDPAVYRYSAMA